MQQRRSNVDIMLHCWVSLKVWHPTKRWFSNRQKQHTARQCVVWKCGISPADDNSDNELHLSTSIYTYATSNINVHTEDIQKNTPSHCRQIMRPFRPFRAACRPNPNRNRNPDL